LTLWHPLLVQALQAQPRVPQSLLPKLQRLWERQQQQGQGQRQPLPGVIIIG